ncbi:heparan-alpha-glucosaminide N-acetyltransferase-like [Microplitis mediator]|uniref:heparan-alpha-glucosaminide N-acetyltransferase-like n=1 Tax=Microplitis mediator TaxID=375433 RepID=UPI002556B0E1|nr:heparan-alpha-glucosaminide N-acetyltransferase-like [Microplitis mediator]XP_057337428.1 heparan-alpha-glucosaminide N-acetyltransferase-like [Microplitis mediator]XP_057337429.1 heparan-alpha-glucosaminide N-acetyltransferase-like [Microplitis mediator]XP_057337430.1 heparan-alpha-glucosaminide N-acetyltransferase-like [Microplitis mediator]XP_057337431.1 heparan-alpha-glucosaminide N-acetyltransferase-like [Microplitis mediator]
MLTMSDVDPCPNVNKSLGMDEACFTVINDNSEPVSLFATNEECYYKLCDCLPWANVSAHSNTTLVVPTQYPLHFYFVKGKYQWCHDTFKFDEYGHYGWNLTEEHLCSNVYTTVEPKNQYLPLLAAFMIFTIGAILIGTTRFLIRMFKKFRMRNSLDDQSDLGPLQDSDPPSQQLVRITKASIRVRSIDAFRGIAVLLMIFVNNGGGKYKFFNHSPWYGLTVADLVLPWFAWIMGLTIVLSVRSQLRLSIPRSRIIIKCLKRAMILILLGLIINGQRSTRLSDLRFSGVLQLLGITYFICTSIETLTMQAQRNFHYGRFAFLQDILDAWIQWLIILALTATHLLLTFLLPVPGCPTRYLGPGGNVYHGKYSNCTGGAAGYIDRLILGSHMYNKTNNLVYGHVLPHDPEGIMNTLSAVLIVALGVQAGRILFCYYLHNFSKIIRWFAWAVVLGVIGGFLCDWSKDGMIPVSKNMMTISFVLITSSFAFILFAILYFLIDHHRIWDGAPFTYAGANAIFLYVGHYFTMKSFPWAWKIDNPTHASFLAMNLWTTVLWSLIAYGLYQKDIIITV